MKLTIFMLSIVAVSALTTLRRRGSNEENPATKVVNLLKEMKTTAEAEAKEDDEVYGKMRCWCETNDKEKTEAIKVAEGRIEALTATIETGTARAGELATAIDGLKDEMAADVDARDQAAAIRQKEKEDFEVELQNYKDALAALNQAIDILAKFYASKGEAAASLAQQGANSEVAPRAVAPGVFDNVYESKGGKGVIEMISTVRTEFEHGKKDLEDAEAKAAEDYNKVKAEYQKTLSDLVGKLNLLITQRITSINARDQFSEDKTQEQAEVASAQKYLLQLQTSCQTLLNKYTERVAMRTEEKAAIKKAIKVLEEES